jgi:hypothetical protein
MLTWRDYSRYFYNKFEYGVKNEMEEIELALLIYNLYL